MWSGTLATIPSGWALCDGTNGTPDLLERFIVSVPAATDPGGSGGTQDPTSMTTPAQQLDYAYTQSNRNTSGASYNVSWTADGLVAWDAGSNPGNWAKPTVNAVTLTPKYYKLAFIMKL